VVIILDVIMPGMDGWETLRKLKSDDELRHIPIVMSTIIGDEAMAYTLGAAHFLPKPVDRSRLLELVKLDSESGDPGLALIVEDDDASREASRRTLESAGWEVMEAENGEVGEQRLAERTPDLILLDLMMPVMDGFEFMHHLSENDKATNISIVVLTAKDLTEEEERQLQVHSDTVIHKGRRDHEKLLDAVDRTTGQVKS
jgi:CheY-like chemotaxis protein